MENTQTMRKILYGALLVLIIISMLFIRSYTKEKKENYALRLKVITLNKTRKAPAPWSRILPKPNTTTITTTNNTTTVNDVVSTRASSPQKTNNLPLQERSTTDLAIYLNGNMQNAKALPRTELDRVIEVADEVISRSPDLYSAYKAKLIAMLIEESKFNQQVDENEINNLLETMANFDLNRDQTLRREASLISSANNELDKLNATLGEIQTSREETNSDTTLPDAEKQQRLAALDTKEQETNSVIMRLQTQTEANLLENANAPDEDIVQVPFMRLMAKEDYEGVLDNAQAYIEQFPTSPLGHFYQVRALELMGRNDEALEAIANSKLGKEQQDQIIQMLNEAKNQDPKKYWENLNF